MCTGSVLCRAAPSHRIGHFPPGRALWRPRALQRPHLRDRPGGVRLYRVGAARADLELHHHVVVLVDEVVAVDHVLALVGSELPQHPHRLVLAYVGRVLGAALPRERRPAVAVEDPEVYEVDVQRVEPAARLVLDLPDVYLLLLAPLVHASRVPRPVVDDPLPAAPPELEAMYAGRLGLLELHGVAGVVSGVEDSGDAVVGPA